MGNEYRQNMESWIAALRAEGIEQFANQLSTDNGHKADVLNRTEQAGLPVYPRTVMQLRDFLKNPSVILNNFCHPAYWVSFLPKDPQLPKSTKLNLGTQGVLEFAEQFQNLQDRYDILLGLYEKNEFGGNIISNETNVCCEIVRGDHINIAQGTTKPGEPFIARKRSTDISFSYSTEDKAIREAIWMALQCIRINGTESERSTDLQFMHGYFEFAITSSPTRPTLGICFLDYKTGSSFTTFP